MDMLAKLISHRPQVKKAVLNEVVEMYAALVELPGVGEGSRDQAQNVSKQVEKMGRRVEVMDGETAGESSEAFRLVLVNEPNEEQFQRMVRLADHFSYALFNHAFAVTRDRRSSMRDHNIPNWND